MVGMATYKRVWYYPRQTYHQIIILTPHFCSGPFLYFQYSCWIFSKFDSLCTAENIYKPHFFQLLIK